MCEGCFGLDGDLAEVCGRIRAATAAVPTSDWTVEELCALAELLESVATARLPEVFQVSLAEVISIDSARGRPVLKERRPPRDPVGQPMLVGHKAHNAATTKGGRSSV